MTTIDIWRREKHSAATHFRRAMPAAGVGYRLSAALAAVSAVAGLLTFPWRSGRSSRCYARQTSVWYEAARYP